MVGFDLASSNATSSTTISEGDAQPTVVSLSENSSSEPAGLNKELGELWGCVLGQKPLPTIRAVFSELHREAWRQKEIDEEESKGLGVVIVKGHGIPEKPVAAGWKKKSSSDNKLGGDVCAFQVSNSDPGQ
nr:Retrovirus-related Pol polyprotein from transposon RE1 [Ipomoea batatas]